MILCHVSYSPSNQLINNVADTNFTFIKQESFRRKHWNHLEFGNVVISLLRFKKVLAHLGAIHALAHKLILSYKDTVSRAQFYESVWNYQNLNNARI